MAAFMTMSSTAKSSHDRRWAVPRFSHSAQAQPDHEQQERRTGQRQGYPDVRQAGVQLEAVPEHVVVDVPVVGVVVHGRHALHGGADILVAGLESRAVAPWTVGQQGPGCAQLGARRDEEIAAMQLRRGALLDVRSQISGYGRGHNTENGHSRQSRQQQNVADAQASGRQHRRAEAARR